MKRRKVQWPHVVSTGRASASPAGLPVLGGGAHSPLTARLLVSISAAWAISLLFWFPSIDLPWASALVPWDLWWRSESFRGVLPLRPQELLGPGASADARGEDGFQLVSVSAESPDGHREPTQLLVLADFGLGGFSWEVSWCCSWVFSALFLVIQTNGLWTIPIFNTTNRDFFFFFNS